MRVPKRFIPGFPSCRFERVERLLRDLHLKLFRKYYDVIIPMSDSGDDYIYLWNGGARLSTDDIVSAQPLTGGQGRSWEFQVVGEEEKSDECEDLLSQIEDEWKGFFMNIGRPDAEERLARIDALNKLAAEELKLQKGESDSDGEKISG